MKSIIRLLLIVLNIVFAQNLSANISALSLQQAQEIKAYVQAAKQLGYTDAQIVSEFEHAIQLFDQNNGVLALSLKYDERVVFFAIGVLSLSTVIASIWFIYYLLKDNSAAATNNPANQKNGNKVDQQPPGDVLGGASQGNNQARDHLDNFGAQERSYQGDPILPE